MRRSPRLRIVAAVALATTTAAGLLAYAPGAQAAPIYPSGYHLIAISHTTIRVGLNRVADRDLTSYRLVASTDKTKLTTAYLNAHSFHSTYSTSARSNAVSLGGMAYTTKAYYYRVGVTYGRYRNYVAWGATISGGFGLAPAAPTGLTTVHGAAGDYLAWTQPAGQSTGAAIDQTNLTKGSTVTYTIHGTTGRFTPYGLATGATYSYTVRAMTLATHSSPSSTSASIVGPSTASAFRLMSYNVLGAVYKTDVSAGKTVPLAGWANRVTGAAALVKQVMPDVLDVQEGDTILGSDGTSHAGNHAYPTPAWPGDWWSQPAAVTPKAGSCNQLYTHSDAAYVGGAHYWPYRQVDALCDSTNKALGNPTLGYARAIDGTPKHNGSTNYFLYNSSTVTQLTAAQLGVGSSECWMSDDSTDAPNDVAGGAATPSNTKCGGFFSLESSTSAPTERTAAWAVFRLKATGATVLIVSPHTSAELGTGWDARRATQVQNLVSRTQQIASKLYIANVVYGGDFNNYVGRPGLADSTTPVMRTAGYPDAIDAAQHASNTKYLSGNQYLRTPLATPDKKPGFACLDHVFVSPGIAVRSFNEALRLNSTGQFADAAIPSDHNPVWTDLYLRDPAG